MPPERRRTLEEVKDALTGHARVVLTTHVQADGDGTGSQGALAAWLETMGTEVHIVNPTPFPDMFRFLLDDPSIIADAGTVAGEAALRAADLLVVLDTAEPRRTGRVARWTKELDVVVIDHHVRGENVIDGVSIMDPSASATGELICDLLDVAGLRRPWPRQVLEGIYTAIVTDTGSFRFSNTTPRTHAIAGDLIAQGVDPEEMYRRIFATVPLHRIELLRHALERLRVDPDFPISWITLEGGVMERLGASSEDLDGIIEHARSIEGTEVAILMRETSDGGTKVSLRSAGPVDVNAIARHFGGGGHVKASGALLSEGLEVAQSRVLDAVRTALAEGGAGFRASRGDH